MNRVKLQEVANGGRCWRQTSLLSEVQSPWPTESQTSFSNFICAIGNIKRKKKPINFLCLKIKEWHLAIMLCWWSLSICKVHHYCILLFLSSLMRWPTRSDLPWFFQEIRLFDLVKWRDLGGLMNMKMKEGILILFGRNNKITIDR